MCRSALRKQLEKKLQVAVAKLKAGITVSVERSVTYDSSSDITARTWLVHLTAPLGDVLPVTVLINSITSTAPQVRATHVITHYMYCLRSDCLRNCLRL